MVVLPSDCIHQLNELFIYERISGVRSELASIKNVCYAS
jgi:hypothetical protein